MFVELNDIVQNGFSEISQSNIDSVYNILTDFNSMTDENKNGFVSAMVDLCTNALKMCAVAEQSERELSQEVKDTLRICLYFYQQMLFRIEAAWTPAEGAEKGTKSKAKRSRAANEDLFDWSEYRPICMQLLQQATAMNPVILWRMGLVAEAYMSSCWKFPLALLEKAAEGGTTGASAGSAGISGSGAAEVALRTKCCEVIRTAIAVISVKASSGDVFVPIVSAFVDSICHYEAMATQIAKLLAQLPAGNLLTAALMREVGTLNMADLNRSNSSSVKNIGTLITTLSTAVPEQMSLFMPMVMQQLNSEIYQIRSALLQSMGLTCEYICSMIMRATEEGKATEAQLLREEAAEKAQRKAARAARVAAVADEDDEADEEAEEEEEEAATAIDSLGSAMQHLSVNKSSAEHVGGRSHSNIEGLLRVRDKMLDLLVERVHDTSHFTRAVVLKVWIRLVEARSVPVNRIASVAQIAMDRLMDKTALVRRAAIALFASLTDNNPFAGELDLAMFSQRKNELQGLMSARIALLLKDSEITQEAEATSSVMALSPVKPRKPAKVELATISENDEEEDSEDEAEVAEEEDLLLKTQREILQAEATAQLFESDEELKSWHLQLTGYIRFAIEFIGILQSALPVVGQMFLSKTQGDVVHSLRFVAKAVKFNLPGSSQCLRESFSLIWHAEEPIRQECVRTFVSVYLTSGSCGGFDDEEETGASGGYAGDSIALSPAEVADNLVALYADCSTSVGETTSLEKLIGELYNANEIAGGVVKALWAVAEGDNSDRVGCALFIMAMIAKCQPTLISAARVHTLVAAMGAGFERRCDVTVRGALQCVLAGPPCVAMPSTTISETVVNNTNYGSVTELQRAYLAVIAPIQAIITYSGAAAAPSATPAEAETNTWRWFQACELALHALFHVAPNPDAVLANAVSHLYEGIVSESGSALDAPSDNAPVLARFLYVLGQGAMCTLVYAERMANIVKKVRDINAAVAKQKASAPASKATAKKTAEDASAAAADNMEAEMGLTAALDAEHDRNFAHMTEFELAFNGDNLFGKFHAFVAFIAANENGQFGSMLLRHTSTVALCRFMSISSTLCEQYLPLLFTILECEDSAINVDIASASAGQLRTTIMICLGDLAFRFPNALEPWTNRMYARLADADTNVRYNTLMVLTHLVLNDMIKVKGQVVHVVLCISDKTQAIQDLAKLLFRELSKRSNNPVYNLLGDIIAQLSATAGIVSGLKNVDQSIESAGSESAPEIAAAATDSVTDLRVLSNVEFQQTMSFLLQFVNKDKQGDSLLERLLCRFATSISTRQNRHLSYCISQLPITEKGVKKMVDLFK